MAKTLEELRQDGYSEKAAKAIIKARQKKEETQNLANAVHNMGSNLKARNKALNDIYNW